MSTTQQAAPQGRTINPDALNALLWRVVQDMGAAMQAPLILIGDRLGLYRAMGDGVPVTPAELAKRTGTAERYVREWLSNQAAGGYVSYDPDERAFWLTPEQSAAVMADASLGPRVRAEIGDVTIYLVRLADVLGIDLVPAALDKLADSARRYTVEAARGSAAKISPD